MNEQSHIIVQQLSDNICKKENIKHDKQEENTLSRNEKYETAVKISKLESELESAKIRKENSRTKLETSVRLLTDENESLREKLSMQQADNEKMSCEFRLLKEKYDTQFNEILSLKSIGIKFTYLLTYLLHTQLFS